MMMSWVLLLLFLAWNRVTGWEDYQRKGIFRYPRIEHSGTSSRTDVLSQGQAQRRLDERVSAVLSLDREVQVR
jgi:hypothetical protein